MPSRQLTPNLPYLLPLRHYLRALTAKAGMCEARDFALGVLNERVRQEENGWPDEPGDRVGKRTAHGTGPSHLCLLERKHRSRKPYMVRRLLRDRSRSAQDASSPMRIPK
jgi:hypothetical protein